MECAKIRADRCPLFADKYINVAEAEKRLPESGVPNGILRGAVEMDTLQYFEPKLGGPATHGIPFSADQAQSKAGDDVEEYPGEVEDKETHRDPACLRAADALIAEENANAEFLIGLDGSPDDDAVTKLAAFRSKCKWRRICKRELWRQRPEHKKRPVEKAMSPPAWNPLGI